MNFFDIVFSAIFLFSAGAAIRRGPSRVLIHLLFLTAGYIAAESLYNRYFEYLLKYTSHIGIAKIGTYLGIFIGITAVGFFLQRIFNRYSKPSKKNGWKVIISVLMGLYNAGICFLIILFIVSGFVPSFNDDLNSSFYMDGFRYFKGFIDGIKLA